MGSWKMNLMDDARKIGNDTQGGWAPMPKLRREDENDNSSENEEEELNQEELEELEAEIDDLQPEEITNPNKPEIIKEERKIKFPKFQQNLQKEWQQFELV